MEIVIKFLKFVKRAEMLRRKFFEHMMYCKREHNQRSHDHPEEMEEAHGVQVEGERAVHGDVREEPNALH